MTYILYLSGAKIAGYSLKPKNKYDNFWLLNLENKIENSDIIIISTRWNKKDFKNFNKTIEWLKSYNKNLFKNISPYLLEKEKNWLYHNTIKSL